MAMNQKQIEIAVSNLAFGMFTMMLAILVVSPLIGLALGGALRLAAWLWGYELLPFGRAFVLGWGGCLAWIMVSILVEKLRPIKVDNISN